MCFRESRAPTLYTLFFTYSRTLRAFLLYLPLMPRALRPLGANMIFSALFFPYFTRLFLILLKLAIFLGNLLQLQEI